METIEDRAYKYYPKAGIVDGTGRYAYIKGAKEQQDIDIKKVYHALEKVLAKDLLDELVKTLKGE